MKSIWQPKDDSYEASARLACLINVTQMLIRCQEQVLTLYNLQIPPRFNMYLIINKSTTVLLFKISLAIIFATVQIPIYEGHLESKERFAIKKYLLIIGKKKIMQVLSHTFTYFST